MLLAHITFSDFTISYDGFIHKCKLFKLYLYI